MNIKAICTFMHGKERFEKDQEYEVEDGPGYYFVANGWASDTAPITLEIQDAPIDHTANNAGE